MLSITNFRRKMFQKTPAEKYRDILRRSTRTSSSGTEIFRIKYYNFYQLTLFMGSYLSFIRTP